MAEISFLPYIFSSILAFLGFAIGYVLLRISPEEKKPLRNQVLILRHFSFYAAASSCFAFPLPTIIAFLIFGALILAMFFALTHLKNDGKGLFFPYILGTSLGISSMNDTLFPLVFLSVILYGISTSLLQLDKKTSMGTLLFRNAIFFPAAMIGYFLL